jgi:acetyl esterase/lipase
MDINRVHPELRKATASFPKLPVGGAFGRALTRLLLPLLLPRAKAPAGVSITWQTAPSGQKLRVYTPAGSSQKAALLYIHGGGMMIGAAKMDDVLLAGLAADLGILVVSPEYRLAPENPYPSAIDDCNEAWHWMLNNAANLAIDTKRIAIGGESAGGGLAAGSVLRIHDEGGTQPIAQWLFCPMLDDRTARRDEAKARLEQLGAKVSGSVSKKTRPQCSIYSTSLSASIPATHTFCVTTPFACPVCSSKAH